jgi:hypothetical protein
MRLLVLLELRGKRLSEPAFRRPDDLRKIEEVLFAQRKTRMSDLERHITTRTHTGGDAGLI